MSYLIFAFGLALLIKGADMLVDGASSLARVYGVPPIVVGLTIVAFGTSLPELVVSVFAGYRGNAEIVMGNVIGSNICNVLLILGISAAISPVKAGTATVTREIPFVILASLVLSGLVNDRLLDGENHSGLERTDGIALLGMFLIFMYYIALSFRGGEDRPLADDQEKISPTRSAVFIVAGLAFLMIGGRLAVSSAVNIATAWGVSEAFIGLTIVALGTSLPELATSAVAAYRKNSDIAVGNIVGSNIFNIFVVLGIPGLFFRVPFDESMNVDLLVMNVAAMTLFICMFVGRPERTVSRLQGGIMVALYAGYTVTLLMRG